MPDSKKGGGRRGPNISDNGMVADSFAAGIAVYPDTYIEL